MVSVFALVHASSFLKDAFSQFLLVEVMEVFAAHEVFLLIKFTKQGYLFSLLVLLVLEGHRCLNSIGSSLDVLLDRVSSLFCLVILIISGPFQSIFRSFLLFDLFDLLLCLRSLLLSSFDLFHILIQSFVFFFLLFLFSFSPLLSVSLMF